MSDLVRLVHDKRLKRKVPKWQSAMSTTNGGSTVSINGGSGYEQLQ